MKEPRRYNLIMAYKFGVIDFAKFLRLWSQLC